MDDLWKKVKKGLSQAFEKSEEITKLSTKKIEIIGLQHNIQKAFTELGAYVYKYHVEEKKKNMTKDKDFKGIIQQIIKLQELLEKKEKEINKI